MTSISAPSTYRPFANIPPLNRSANDTITGNGVRISIPVYIDPPTTMRKEILNVLRTKATEPIATSNPNTMSGIQVVSYSTRQPEIEAYLGLSLDNLRNTLFSRGGLEVSLILKLQNVTGLDIVSDKELTTAFDSKKKLSKAFSTEHPFMDDNATNYAFLTPWWQS